MFLLFLSSLPHYQAEYLIFQKWPIHYFPIVHNALCLPPKILHKPLLSNTLGRSAYSQEHSPTIVYAKFGGLTECIMGNWKIENKRKVIAIFRSKNAPSSLEGGTGGTSF